MPDPMQGYLRADTPAKFLAWGFRWIGGAIIGALLCFAIVQGSEHWPHSIVAAVAALLFSVIGLILVVTVLVRVAIVACRTVKHDWKPTRDNGHRR